MLIFTLVICTGLMFDHILLVLIANILHVIIHTNNYDKHRA